MSTTVTTILRNSLIDARSSGRNCLAGMRNPHLTNTTTNNSSSSSSATSGLQIRNSSMVAASATTTTSRTYRWLLGMIVASTFSMIYFVAPFYMLTAVLAVLFRFPSWQWALCYALPIIISALLKPIPMPALIQWLQPILDYFEFERIVEVSPINVYTEIVEHQKNYLCVFQPHGALSYTAICSAVSAEPAVRGKLPTAVADAILYTPILKHVLGIFGIISASKRSIQETLRQPGAAGCVVLYVGGMAELFLSCEHKERLYLKNRKGFIKLALQEGVDIIPVYLFGNTTVLSVLKTGLLANLSRRFQVSLTYIWGRWGLPIPRDCKLLYVSGQPLGLPHIPNPSQADIDHWHHVYCKQVTRLFDTYKERVPEYKHKQLEIV